MKAGGRAKVVTFYSHFQAMKFASAFGKGAELRPVPRSLSSSCGDCVFLSDNIPLEEIKRKCGSDDAEAVYSREKDKYTLICRFGEDER